MNHPQTILTGDRPTGQLHLGHYVGSLRQRVALQHNHQQFILIADLQGLTDNGSNPQKISHHILEVMADYLAVGIDPRLTTICLQSALPALAELSALYMNIVTVARVERNPTVKNEIAQKGFARSLPVGFLAYPISQAADITAFKAELVPVGDDQLPMIEQTNEIVHKMNSLTGEPVLRHCKALLSEVSRLAGRRWQRQNVEIAGQYADVIGHRGGDPPRGQRDVYRPDAPESQRSGACRGQRGVYLSRCIPQR